MLFLLARELPVSPLDPPSPNTPVTIKAGEKVRLLPELGTASAQAHVVWQGQTFTCDRKRLLTSSSLLGPAPD